MHKSGKVYKTMTDWTTQKGWRSPGARREDHPRPHGLKKILQLLLPGSTLPARYFRLLTQFSLLTSSQAPAALGLKLLDHLIQVIWSQLSRAPFSSQAPAQWAGYQKNLTQL